MNYLSVADVAWKWKLSERTVRNYCANSRIAGAFLVGKTWHIPEDAERPDRRNKRNHPSKTLLDTLRAEQDAKISGGIYHKLQIEMTYNSNHMEGSHLSFDQTRYMFEMNAIAADNSRMNVDDIVETANHFKCVDMIIRHAKYQLSEKFIKELHMTLKNGTSDSRTSWFAVGEYKYMPNEVGGRETTAPELVAEKVRNLLSEYNQQKDKSLEEIIDFHVCFERIHPFQDGNGRVGRLIMLKECLRNDIVPFIIDDEMKMYYYRGLREWDKEKGYLMDTCLAAQDTFRKYLDYFRIGY